jgi:predicted AAA+ superfamily ATPase
MGNNVIMFKRTLNIPKGSFFLFGPRGVGKSSFLKNHKFDLIIDLLKEEDFMELLRNPSLLERRTHSLKEGAWILIDEVQRIPSLTNEVHRLIESKKFKFALTGSSARKLKLSGANMLGGRALTLKMEPLSAFEMREAFNLKQALAWGQLPLVVNQNDVAPKILQSYLQTYLKEEIAQEGLVRKLEPFARFIEISGIMNGQTLNFENLSREAHIKHSTVQHYFELLEDTLIAHKLPAYRPGVKVREGAKAKFYYFDAGVARAAAGYLFEDLDPAYEGFLFETFLFHELRCFNEYSEKFRTLSHYSCPSGDIDFVIELKKRTTSRKAEIICIEAKRSRRWESDFEREMRNIDASGKVKIAKKIGVYFGDKTIENDRVTVFPVLSFLEQLHSGKIF